MDEHTIFRICSMTKSFVGALAAVLADRGDVNLDDPISLALPEFTGEKCPITLRQCLSMTAGFAELSPTMNKNRALNTQDPSDVAHEMAEVPLKAPPGTCYNYSNSSFEIAAAVLERHTGQRLDVLLDEVFFRPLGMSDTTFRPVSEMESRIAQVYKTHETPPSCIRINDPIVKWPPAGKQAWHISASGGLFSTPHDIMQFYKMLLRGGKSEEGHTVMTEGAMRLITTKQTPDCVSKWYSFGFSKFGDRWIGHEGFYGTVAECDLSECRMRMIFTQMGGKQCKVFSRKWRQFSRKDFKKWR